MSSRCASRARWFAAAALACPVGLAAPAHAGSIQYEPSQTQIFQFTPNGPDETFSFDQFDDQGGTRTLREVIIEVEGLISALVTVENASDITAQFTMAVAEGDMSFMLGGFSLPDLTMIDSVIGPPLDPSDGIPGSGSDYYSFGTIGATSSDSSTLTNPPDDLSAFIGNGTVDGLASALAGFTVQGPTSTRVRIEDVAASGSVTVTYGFQSAVVPLPPAAGLGIAGLALVAWRRKRKNA